MHALQGLLPRCSTAPGPGARSCCAALRDPPWAIRLQDESPLTLTAVVRGHAWVLPDAGEPVRLAAGDLVISRGPDHWSLADEPGSPPFAVIGPGQECRTPDGRPLATELHQGVRSWGTSATGETVLLTGAYLGTGEVGSGLLRALAPTVVLRAAELDSPLVGLLAEEVLREAPGQEAVLDRLLDLLVIAALRLLQHHPEKPWSVADLAAAAGVSRAAFARRFAAVVGMPPIRFLTEWRLDLAADLLADPEPTLAEIARRVGYSTPFALSAAFTRVRGVRPSQLRRAPAAGS